MFFFIIFIKSKIINHDCNSHFVNLDKFHDDLFDYKISCPYKKIQKIYITNNKNIKTISLLKESNVVIESSPKAKLINLSLLIFDKPNIKFDFDTVLNTIEIYGSPTISIPKHKKISVENLIISNSSFQYFFNPKKVIYTHKNNKQILLLNESYINESYINVFQCKSQLKFTTSDKLYVTCNNLFDISINYDDLRYSYFINDNNNPIIIANKKNYDSDYNILETIFNLISFYEKESIILSNFINISLLDPYLTNFKSENSQLLLTLEWSEFASYSVCPWVDGVYKEKYKYLEKYYDEIEITTKWHKTCINQNGYLYYQIDQLKGKMIITTATFFGIIAAIIVCVLLVILSLYLIALKIHYKKLKNLSANEDLSDLGSNENDSLITSNNENKELDTSYNENNESDIKNNISDVSNIKNNENDASDEYIDEKDASKDNND